MYSSTITQFEEPPRKKNPEEVAAEPVYVPPQKAEQPIIWRMAFGIVMLHYLAIDAFCRYWDQASIWTYVFTALWGWTTGFGVTAGAHRLWAHRSYSAKLPLRILLAALFCATGQKTMFTWVRDHRTHHKFTETPADPHDANRGFFFSHIGWLMVRRHPAVKENGKKVDMSDILADPVVRFFDKYYVPVMLMLSFVVPTLIPVYGWNESLYLSFMGGLVRWCILLNMTFLVNSIAHMWGNRPYNQHMKPVDNPTVAFLALGEGWHNYHHVFPWDYKASELGKYSLNVTTLVIEFFAWLGLAYDLKSPSPELVHKTSLNKGDGSESYWGNNHHANCHDETHHHHHHHHHHH